MRGLLPALSTSIVAGIGAGQALVRARFVKTTAKPTSKTTAKTV
jgi:hypothetical protein